MCLFDFKEKRLRRPQSFAKQNSLRKHKPRTNRVCEKISEYEYKNFILFDISKINGLRRLLDGRVCQEISEYEYKFYTL